jgi:hypothetical protein
MMVVGNVLGEEGTVWAGAREVDPTCYRAGPDTSPVFAPPTILPHMPGTCPVPVLTAEGGEGGAGSTTVVLEEEEKECGTACFAAIMLGGFIIVTLLLLWLTGAFACAPSPCAQTAPAKEPQFTATSTPSASADSSAI